MRPVGPGVLEDDGSGWVGKHGCHSFFHASTDFALWTLHMLMEHEDVLRSVGIYDDVWAFKDSFELDMRAIIKCFWPTTSTFVTPNGLKEIKEVTCLPILGELYEEYFHVEFELAAKSEEFKTLFFPVLGFYEYVKEGRWGPENF